jgi:hypothetical protein
MLLTTAENMKETRYRIKVRKIRKFKLEANEVHYFVFFGEFEIT